MEILKAKLEQCEEWAAITAFLVIMGELYSSINSEERRGYLEPFARWMLRKGGLKEFENFTRKKQKANYKSPAFTAMMDFLQEIVHFMHQRRLPLKEAIFGTSALFISWLVELSFSVCHSEVFFDLH